MAFLKEKCSFVEILLAKPVRICYSNIGVAERHKLGGLTEWLRSLIGNQVRCNSPVGSSPMSSAIRDGSEQSLPFLRFCWNFNGYGLRSASFSLKYRPIRRGWCCLRHLHRYPPSPFEIFGYLRKFDITKLIFPRIWSVIFIEENCGSDIDRF